MNIVFQINGGMGKCIMATAVCEAIKKQYPKSTLIVISGYPDVFLNNPNVDRTFAFGGFSYFYEDYIEGRDFKVFIHDPYLETSHLLQEEHLICTWCSMFGIKYDGEQPKIYLSSREQKFYSTKFSFDKPILLLQTNGGASSDMKYSWARDIPRAVVVAVVDQFKDSYTILHIKKEDQLQYDNTIPVTDNFRSLSVLVSVSAKRLFVDSFAQHTAAALGLKSTVCWIVNKPEVFGYELHDNIVSNPFTAKPELKGAYLNKFNISGDLLEFPYNSETEIFNIHQIVTSIKQQ
jgi:hypothetical protein